MTRLSAVIITFNEERNIGRCIGSLKPVADEILVVDSLSTDRTVEICQQEGARVISQPWKGYSEQKNFANSLATFDWILSVDADEALSDKLANSLLDWKLQPVPHFAMFNRLTSYCGKWIRHGAWYPDPKIRLFNRNFAKWQGEVHEKLIFDQKIKVVHLKGDLLHYSYNTVDEHFEQTLRFGLLAGKELYHSGKKIKFYNVILNPPIKFFRNYLYKRGWMDGKYGYVISKMAALQTFVKYLKAWQLQKNNTP